MLSEIDNFLLGKCYEEKKFSKEEIEKSLDGWIAEFNSISRVKFFDNNPEDTAAELQGNISGKNNYIAII